MAAGERSSAASRGIRDRRPSSAALSRLEGGLFWALVGGLVLMPFWFGGEELIILGLAAIYFSSLAILYEGGLWWSGGAHPVHVRRLSASAAGFLLVTLWAAWQLAAWSPVSYHHPIWEMAKEALGAPLKGAITVSPDQTGLALTRWITAGLVFWLSVQLCRSATRARRLVAAIAIAGAVYAFYGLVARYLIPDTILWHTRLYYTDAVASTFINRNTYATYAGLGLVCALTLGARHFLQPLSPDAPWRFELASAIAALVGRGGAWLAAVFLLGTALILTGSRGGVLATLCGLVFFAALIAARRR